MQLEIDIRGRCAFSQVGDVWALSLEVAEIKTNIDGSWQKAKRQLCERLRVISFATEVLELGLCQKAGLVFLKQLSGVVYFVEGENVLPQEGKLDERTTICLRAQRVVL